MQRNYTAPSNSNRGNEEPIYKNADLNRQFATEPEKLIEEISKRSTELSS